MTKMTDPSLAAQALLYMTAGNDQNRTIAGNQVPHIQNPGLQQAPQMVVPPDQMTQLLAAMTALMQQNVVLQQQTANQAQLKRMQYNILIDLSHNIGDFDGLSGAASARTWIHQLESIATLHNWTEAIAFETARSHLTKAARNCYLANLDSLTN